MQWHNFGCGCPHGQAAAATVEPWLLLLLSIAPLLQVDKQELAKLCVHKYPAATSAGAVRAAVAAAVRQAGQSTDAEAAVKAAELEGDSRQAAVDAGFQAPRSSQ